MALAVGPAASAATHAKVNFRIYDPKGLIHAQVTLSGLVRSAARAWRPPYSSPGHGALSLTFNRTGETAFCRLTRGLARRGARLHRVQYQGIVIDGWVSTKTNVDYRHFPNGLCGSPGLEIQGIKLTTARRLARLIRG
jgi:hypothetical protein